MMWSIDVSASRPLVSRAFNVALPLGDEPLKKVQTNMEVQLGILLFLNVISDYKMVKSLHEEKEILPFINLS